MSTTNAAGAPASVSAEVETFTAKGITYQVIKRTTPEQHREEGRPHLADDLENRGIVGDVWAKRPKGGYWENWYEFARPWGLERRYVTRISAR